MKLSSPKYKCPGAAFGSSLVYAVLNMQMFAAPYTHTNTEKLWHWVQCYTNSPKDDNHTADLILSQGCWSWVLQMVLLALICLPGPTQKTVCRHWVNETSCQAWRVNSSPRKINLFSKPILLSLTKGKKKVKHCKMGSNNYISLRTCLAGGHSLFHEVRDHDTVILTASMYVAINLRN